MLWKPFLAPLAQQRPFRLRFVRSPCLVIMFPAGGLLISRKSNAACLTCDQLGGGLVRFDRLLVSPLILRPKCSVLLWAIQPALLGNSCRCPRSRLRHILFISVLGTFGTLFSVESNFLARPCLVSSPTYEIVGLGRASPLALQPDPFTGQTISELGATSVKTYRRYVSIKSAYCTLY